MAKPDCDDGWYKKSIELEAALDFADFTKLARTILRYGFAQIFGQGRRPRYMKIHPTEIAERIGKHRQHVHRALDELIKSNALVPVPGQPNTFRFVKDYERWTFIARVKSSYVASDILRLTPREVADCRDSISYSRSFELRRDADASGTNFGDTSDDSDEISSPRLVTVCHPDWLQPVTPIGDGLSPRLVTKPSPPKNPLVGIETREEETRQEGRKEALGEDRALAGNEVAGPLAPSLPALERLIAWVRSKLSEMEYDDGSIGDAEELCRRWVGSGGDPEWCAQCFQAAIDNPNILVKTTYARKILVRMHKDAKDGKPVLAPAICDFRPDPTPLAATGTAPAPAHLSHRPTKAQRDAERAKNRSAWLKRAFPSTTEEPGGQG